MNKIDEIALRVADECKLYIRGHYDDIGWTPHDIKKFAHALIKDPELLAELSKDAEPVAVIRNSHQIDFIGCKDLPTRTELFTHSLPAADIKQRVAEVFVTKFKRHVGGDGEFWLHELENFCKDGKWRE